MQYEVFLLDLNCATLDNKSAVRYVVNALAKSSARVRKTLDILKGVQSGRPVRFFCATIMVAVRGGAFGFAGFPLSAGFCGPAYGHHPARKTDDDLIQYLKGVKL
jgi:NADH:ubiquinone oxidoreductase subunit 2 (subunit N)